VPTNERRRSIIRLPRGKGGSLRQRTMGTAGRRTPTKRHAASSMGCTSTSHLTITEQREKKRDDSVARSSPRYGQGRHLLATTLVLPPPPLSTSSSLLQPDSTSCCNSSCSGISHCKQTHGCTLGTQETMGHLHTVQCSGSQSSLPEV
jgi:hypothetical protein